MGTTGTLFQPLREFLRTEAAGGLALLAAALLALLWANLDPAAYERSWSAPLPLGSLLDLDRRHWVNEALMALFFFVVGLEIKRELVDGELRGARRAALPIVAAAGGMAGPALIYLALNPGGPGARGWGIPVATDIAFAVGVLAIFGASAPIGLRVFLLSLAIVDDIGAIAVIAIFYSSRTDVLPLALAALMAAAFALSWRLPRWPVGAPLAAGAAAAAWLATHASGIHATIAGVALGLLVPAGRRPDPSPAERLEHRLHPWTSFLVVPLFALANAGVSLAPERWQAALGSPIALGVLAGLVVGKLVGISGAAFLGTRVGLAALPEGVTWSEILAVAALAGIGFTVSLFIAALAFPDRADVDAAKLGIIAASLLASLLGWLLLELGRRRAREAVTARVREG